MVAGYVSRHLPWRAQDEFQGSHLIHALPEKINKFLLLWFNQINRQRILFFSEVKPDKHQDPLALHPRLPLCVQGASDGEGKREKKGSS